MHRSVSRLLGLILLVAMIAGQASITALAQSTPVASPSAGQPPTYNVEMLGTATGVGGPSNTWNLFLIRITAEYGSSITGLGEVPVALFHIDTGQFEFNIESANGVSLNAGSGGPIYASDNKTIVCDAATCDLLKDHPDVKSVILKPGNAIALESGTFTIDSQEPTNAKAFFTGSGSMTASVMASFCWICPTH